MNTRLLRFAVVGMQGFSRSHIDSIRKLRETDAGIRLAAVSNHLRAADPGEVKLLEGSGVKIFDTLPDLLGMEPPPDVVCIPTGIHLHVPMAIAALQKGCSVIVEKPVAGTVQEVDELIAARNRAGRHVVVGFQHLAQDRYRDIKQRLNAGIIGRIREIRCMAAAPRPVSYYRRNLWAGRLAFEGRWILDSPFNNAFAHFLMQCLYFAGMHDDGAACPVRVAAELYRAQTIESPDTACLDIVCDNRTRILFNVSHAVEEHSAPEITVCGESGKLIIALRELHIEKNGIRERIEQCDTEGTPFSAMARLLRGERDVAYCDLETARRHTLAVNGAHLSSAVHALPPHALCRRELESAAGSPQDHQFVIKHLLPGLRRAYEEGLTLHQTAACPWTRAGEAVDISAFGEFKEPRID